MVMTVMPSSRQRRRSTLPAAQETRLDLAWSAPRGRPPPMADAYSVSPVPGCHSGSALMAAQNTPQTDDAASPPADREPDRLAQPVDDEQPPRLPFPVVGIGASAGGLEAVSEFLRAMRPDCGMAFVVVQHLPPDRESQMAEILARHTAMPVAQVEDGMEVEPDHVYVIRPGHVLTIREGRLHLAPALG